MDICRRSVHIFELSIVNFFGSDVSIDQFRADDLRVQEADGAALADGELTALLRLNALNLGEQGDSAVEIAALELLLEDAPVSVSWGDPSSAGLSPKPDFVNLAGKIPAGVSKYTRQRGVEISL